MDVGEELLVPELVFRVAGEPLECGIDEFEPEVHVVGDNRLPHGRGHGLELAPDFGQGALDLPPSPVLPPGEDRQEEEQCRSSAAARASRAVGHIPGIARRPEKAGLRGRCQPHLRGIGLGQDDQSGAKPAPMAAAIPAPRQPPPWPMNSLPS